MTTNSSLNAYRAHDLNIAIRTSSGDEINLDFSNKQSLSLQSSQNENGSSSELNFSSQQRYKFEVKSNGIDAQDAKEIKEFLKIAQPYIDNFFSELEGESASTPLNKVADDINSILAPIKEKDVNTQNFAKNNVVNLFDNALKQADSIDKLFADAQKLLDKVLDGFDKEFKDFLYA